MDDGTVRYPDGDVQPARNWPPAANPQPEPAAPPPARPSPLPESSAAPAAAGDCQPLTDPASFERHNPAAEGGSG